MPRARFISLLIGFVYAVYVVMLSLTGTVIALSPQQRKLMESGIDNFNVSLSCLPESVNENVPSTPTVPDVDTGTILTDAEKIDAFEGTQIAPKAIILHWTAGEYDTPQALVETLRGRDRSVQLTVDKEGKVYQLAKTLETRPHQSMADDGWNDVSIGIEIESGAFGETEFDKYEKDLLDNSVQFKKVVAVVKELMAKYAITNEKDTAGKKGVFGHLEANASSADPGANYMTRIRAELGNSDTPPTPDPDATETTVTRSCVCDAAKLVGTGGGGNVGVGKDFSLGPLDDGKTRRVNLVKALMSDFNLTAEQAAGPVGNFMAESGGAHLPPDVNQGDATGSPPDMDDGGYGWAQWSYGRHIAFANYGVDNGYVASLSEHATDASNYAFLKFELSGAYAETIEELKTIDNPEDAAVSFESTYEKAGVKAHGKRSANARQAFDEFIASGGNSGGNGTATSGSCGGPSGVAAIVGDVAFPLLTHKGVIENPGMFAGGTSNQGGHPYIAYDILVPPNVEVGAFMKGTVNRIGQDRCPGRLISIYNEESDLTITYMHLDFDDHVPDGTQVVPGQRIAIVGPAANGCGIAHLHIDAIKGSKRLSCSRLGCPSSTRALFVDIGPELFTTFQALPGHDNTVDPRV